MGFWGIPKLAEKYERKVIIYYGPSGHGKGLVDAMSAFGLKGPLMKAGLTEDFKYNSSIDIKQLMDKHFLDDEQKLYFVVNVADLMKLRQEGRRGVPIPGCVKNSIHMLCFFPDGTILQKVNICSCQACWEGNFLDCYEKGSEVQIADNSDDSDLEYEIDDFGDENEYLNESYELRSDCVLDIIQVGSIIAIFSHLNSFELFYICKVLKFGDAAEDLSDNNNHVVLNGNSYILVNYSEKKVGYRVW